MSVPGKLGELVTLLIIKNRMGKNYTQRALNLTFLVQEFWVSLNSVKSHTAKDRLEFIGNNSKKKKKRL